MTSFDFKWERMTYELRVIIDTGHAYIKLHWRCKTLPMHQPNKHVCRLWTWFYKEKANNDLSHAYCLSRILNFSIYNDQKSIYKSAPSKTPQQWYCMPSNLNIPVRAYATIDIYTYTIVYFQIIQTNFLLITFLNIILYRWTKNT